MEANTRPEQTKPFPQGGKIQNGDTGNHQNISPTRGVGHLSRLQGRLLPRTNTGTIQEISQISYPGPDLQFKALPFGLSTAPMEFTVIAKEVKLMAAHQGIRIHQYLDDWLVRARSKQSCLRHTQILVRMCQDLGWLVNLEKSELEPKQVFDFVGYQFDLRSGRVRPTAKPSGQDTSIALTTDLSGPAIHVTNRTPNGHRKAGSPRSFAHKTHTVASQKPLESTRVTREDHSSTQVFAPSLTVAAGGKQCAPRPASTPNKACSANFYRRIKRRVGRSLKRAHCKRLLVSSRKQATHKLPRTQGSLSSLKRVPRPLCKPNSPSGYRQHNSRSIHKQGRRHEVGPSVCPPVENLDLVFPETSDSKSPSYSRQAKCDSRQAIQTGPDHPDGVVPPPGNISKPMQEVAPASNRSLRHQVQLQATSVCVSSSGLPSGGSGCSHPAMGGSGRLCLSTNRHLGQVVEKLLDTPCRRLILIAPGWPNMPWFWDLVAMSSQVPLSL